MMRFSPDNLRQKHLIEKILRVPIKNIKGHDEINSDSFRATFNPKELELSD
jgi:hypothetical protein